MAGPIRNACVARGVLAPSTGVTAFTVPANTVLILKWVAAYNTGPAAASIGAFIQGGSPNAAIRIAGETVELDKTFVWAGWTCLNSGDRVTLGSGAATFNYWIAGALLPFIPGQTSGLTDLPQEGTFWDRILISSLPSLPPIGQ